MEIVEKLKNLTKKVISLPKAQDRKGVMDGLKKASNIIDQKKEKAQRNLQLIIQKDMDPLIEKTVLNVCQKLLAEIKKDFDEVFDKVFKKANKKGRSYILVKPISDTLVIKTVNNFGALKQECQALYKRLNDLGKLDTKKGMKGNELVYDTDEAFKAWEKSCEAFADTMLSQLKLYEKKQTQREKTEKT